MRDVKRIRISLGILQALVALGAIPAGLIIIIKPDGSGLGLDKGLLASTPFNNFLLPGLFLFFVNGLFNVFAAIISFKGSKFCSNLGMITGFILIQWITVQVLFVGLINFLQPLFLIIGIVEFFFGYLLINYHK